MAPEARSDRPQWAPRVHPRLLKRLYALDARGILDEALIDEVGYALFARCESILAVTEAHNKRMVPCPLCGERIHHAWDDSEVLNCGACNWRLTWGDYRKTYRKRQLHAGGMEPFIRAFVDDFQRATSAREKMVLIDILVHRYHGEFEGAGHRPGALNLIAVRRLKEGLAFLDELGGRDPQLRYQREADAWVEKVRREQRPGWQFETLDPVHAVR